MKPSKAQIRALKLMPVKAKSLSGAYYGARGYISRNELRKNTILALKKYGLIRFKRIDTITGTWELTPAGRAVLEATIGK